jgi:hypothetical protein
MTHRQDHLDAAHLADTVHVEKVHVEHNTLTRIQSAVIFGSIGSGLLACALGAFIFDVGRAVAAW